MKMRNKSRLRCILSVLSFVLVGCGKAYRDTNNYITNVTNNPETIQNSTDSTLPDFAGVYRFANDSILEIKQSVDSDVTFETTGQFLQSVNPKNDTFGTHPSINKKDAEIHNNVVFFVQNFNYTSGQDLEEDDSGSNITGQKQTSVLLELVEERKIRLTIKIYGDSMNNNPNEVVAKRVFESL